MAVADGYQRADAILERARADADQVLRSAVDERRRLLSEIERLREEREELHGEIASLHGGGLALAPDSAPAPTAVDLEVAVANEMRALLVEILADFRSPVAPPAAVEITPVEPAETVSVPPPEIRDSMVEHVDELIKPALGDELVEHIDELPVSEGA